MRRIQALRSAGLGNLTVLGLQYSVHVFSPSGSRSFEFYVVFRIVPTLNLLENAFSSMLVESLRGLRPKLPGTVRTRDRSRGRPSLSQCCKQNLTRIAPPKYRCFSLDPRIIPLFRRFSAAILCVQEADLIPGS